ncbi:MAG: HutD family protein, partial [Gammaproteobacteria bacterium]|nr:HutD family protein [Gammaproteobacteria bacterium]
YPVDATVAAQNFHWRFSSATVLQDGAFTAFPKHQRLLALRQGAGFVLQVDDQQQQLCSPQHLLRFSGNAVSSATLTAGPVVDINLMFNASLQANMWSQRLTGDYLSWPGPLFAGATLLIYADEAEVEVCLQAGEAPLLLAQGDMLQVCLPTTMSKITPKPMPKTMPIPTCFVRAAAVPCSAVFGWVAPNAGAPSV